MIHFKCQQCGREFQLSNNRRRVFCPCGSVEPNTEFEQHEPLKGGVGTELTSILSELGIKEKSSCCCQRLSRQMDDNGVQWCVENHDKILEKMRENASKYSWGEIIAAAASSVSNGIAWRAVISGDPLCYLLDTAIARSGKKNG